MGECRGARLLATFNSLVCIRYYCCLFASVRYMRPFCALSLSLGMCAARASQNLCGKRAALRSDLIDNALNSSSCTFSPLPCVPICGFRLHNHY